MLSSWFGKRVVVRWNDMGQAVGLTDTTIVRANNNRVRLLLSCASSDAMVVWTTASIASPTFYRIPLIRYGAFIEVNRDDDPELVGGEWHAQMVTSAPGVIMTMESILVAE